MKVLHTLLACLLTFSCAFAAHKKPLKAAPTKVSSYGLAEYTNPSWTIDGDIVIPVVKNQASGVVKWGGDVPYPGTTPYSFLLNQSIKYTVTIKSTGTCNGSFNVILEEVSRDGLQITPINTTLITDNGSGFLSQVELTVRNTYPYFLQLKAQPLTPPLTITNANFKFEIRK